MNREQLHQRKEWKKVVDGMDSKVLSGESDGFAPTSVGKKNK